MKTKLDVGTIQAALIKPIEETFESKNYTDESILYYEGQIPIVAYFIKEGQIDLIKNKRTKMSLHRGQVLGLRELVSHQSSGVQAKVKRDSIISFFDLSTVKEILKRDLTDSLRCALQEVIASPYIF